MNSTNTPLNTPEKTVSVTSDSIDSSTRYVPIELLSSPEMKMRDHKNGGPPPTPKRPKKTISVTSYTIDDSIRYVPTELLSSPEMKMRDHKNGGPPPTPKRPKKKQD